MNYYEGLAVKLKFLFDLVKLDNTGNGRFYEAEPYFVFSNKGGNEIYVITRAAGYSLANKWAIQTFNIKSQSPSY